MKGFDRIYNQETAYRLRHKSKSDPRKKIKLGNNHHSHHDKKKSAKPSLLTLEQLADYLRVPVKTLYRAGIKKLGLPGFKRGKSWLFRSEDIAAWQESQKRKKL